MVAAGSLPTVVSTASTGSAGGTDARAPTACGGTTAADECTWAPGAARSSVVEAAGAAWASGLGASARRAPATEALEDTGRPAAGGGWARCTLCSGGSAANSGMRGRPGASWAGTLPLNPEGAAVALIWASSSSSRCSRRLSCCCDVTVAPSRMGVPSAWDTWRGSILGLAAGTTSGGELDNGGELEPLRLSLDGLNTCEVDKCPQGQRPAAHSLRERWSAVEWSR